MKSFKSVLEGYFHTQQYVVNRMRERQWYKLHYMQSVAAFALNKPVSLPTSIYQPCFTQLLAKL